VFSVIVFSAAIGSFYWFIHVAAMYFVAVVAFFIFFLCDFVPFLINRFFIPIVIPIVFKIGKWFVLAALVGYHVIYGYSLQLLGKQKADDYFDSVIKSIPLDNANLAP